MILLGRDERHTLANHVMGKRIFYFKSGILDSVSATVPLMAHMEEVCLGAAQMFTHVFTTQYMQNSLAIPGVRDIGTPVIAT